MYDYKLFYTYRGDLWIIENISYNLAKLIKEEKEKYLKVKIQIVPIK